MSVPLPVELSAAKLSLVALTVNVGEPAGVVAIVVMVNVAEGSGLLPLAEIGFGENDAVAPAGNPVTLRVTDSVPLAARATVIGYVTLFPVP